MSSAPQPRRLSLFDMLCLGVNAIVGSGIYAFPGLLAEMMGPASLLAFGLCGAMCCVIGLCFVEAAGMYQRSGGPYVYASEAGGPTVGFMVGWTCWTAAVLSWAAVASAIPPYLGHLLPVLGTPAGGLTLAVGLTLALGLINYRGVKPGAITLDVLTVAKMVPLVVLAGAGLLAMEPQNLSPIAPQGLDALPRAAFLAMFAFQGFEVVPVPAGETEDPRRNAPLALFGALLGSTLLYMVIQLAAVGSTPGLAGSEQPLALMGQAVLGEAGGKIVAAAAVISMVGFCAGVALAGPRYLEALCQDGHLPGALAARHPRFLTPHRAILASTLLAALFVLLLDFQRLVDLAVLTVGLQYLSTALAVPVLRRKSPHLRRAFRLPLGPLIPAAAVGITAWFSSQAGVKEVLWFCGLLGLGILLRFGGKFRT